MLLIYTHNTKMKTGWIITEDLISTDVARYKPVKTSHPDAQNAQLMCEAMSRYFCEETDRRSIPSLRDAFNGALKYLPNPEQYKYLPRSAAAVERVLVKGA